MSSLIQENDLSSLFTVLWYAVDRGLVSVLKDLMCFNEKHLAKLDSSNRDELSALQNWLSAAQAYEKTHGRGSLINTDDELVNQLIRSGIVGSAKVERANSRSGCPTKMALVEIRCRNAPAPQQQQLRG